MKSLITFLKIWVLCLSGMVSIYSQNTNNCGQSPVQYDLSANNVRARLHLSGHLFSDAAYIFPKPAKNELAVASVYAAGIWTGGLLENGLPAVSASTYRSLGRDHFQGPVLSGITDSSAFCSQWNRFFIVKGENIIKHKRLAKKALSSGQLIDCNQIPEDVLYWPGRNNPYFSQKYGWSLPDIPLAGFWDEDNNGIYNPCKGDFPIVPVESCETSNDIEKAIPTEIVFYVFNDVMANHTQSGLAKTTLETQVHAFAYVTDDEMNDATFYHYKMINKGNEVVKDMYTGFWMDPDLGCYADDYIGCFPSRNLGFIYNEDSVDGIQGADCQGTPSYVQKIPVLGIKLAHPPMVSKIFARDNQGNILFENGQKVLLDPIEGSGLQDTLVKGKMTAFNYFENCGIGLPNPDHCDPTKGNELQFFEALKGRDHLNPGTQMTSKYAFDGEPNDPNGWSMCSQLLPFGDRRILLSSGRRTLQPGESITLTYALFSTFEVRHPCPDLGGLKKIDDKIQSLFDNCFQNKIIGPDAPDLTAESGDRRLIISMDNSAVSNNQNWGYKEKIEGVPNETFYRFEGVKVFQVSDRNVTVNDINKPEFARLVYQTDVQNGVSTIYNWEYVVNPDANDVNRPFIWQQKLKTSGDDTGFNPEFVFDEDVFATGNKTLVNGREYHFMAVAYGYNNYQDFDPQNESGQKELYIQGSHNIKSYSFSPQYIFGPDEQQLQVIRLSGKGNPHQFLRMENDMDEKILSPGFDGRVVYQTGYGPLTGRIVDPSKWDENYLFELFIDGTFDNNRERCSYLDDAFWTLRDVNTNTVLLQNVPLHVIVEYMLDVYGFALTVKNYPSAGTNYLSNYGSIGASMQYDDEGGSKWFGSFIKKDAENSSDEDQWRVAYQVDEGNESFLPFINMNDNPFIPVIASKRESSADLSEKFYVSPGPNILLALSLSPANRSLRMRDLNNVDIVFTSDKSKWSKCVVVETANPFYYTRDGHKTIGDAQNFELRQSPSKGKDGELLNDGTVGFSYFPGYAIDVETGERLNIFFGENSVYSGDNAAILADGVGIGGDLLFNPSSQWISNMVDEDDVRRYVAGGQHYVYVTRQKYDECATIATKLRKGVSTIQKLKAVASLTWCAFPVLSENTDMLPLAQGLIPNDVRVQLRVDQSYSKSRRFNIERERDCETENDRPVYWFTFKKPETSDVDDVSGFEAVRIIPNPSSTETNRFVITNLQKKPLVALYDVTGKLVADHETIQTHVLQFSGDRTFHLECIFSGKLNPGLYLIRLTDEDGTTSFTKKWIVY
ncbi:MAG: T9SS type A sorting domain-containing protein [Saprospiraceae bacterium]|nr:T9SS type A sorting domain-containing protein [Saprospiraceae bacterium]